MKQEMSKSWRGHGEKQAFDHGAWEFQARQFRSSAVQLLCIYDAQVASPTFDSIMCIPTATFLLSLAVELISKAYYLKSGAEPKDAIYSHNVGVLVDGNLLSSDQRKLMDYAEEYVIWAGRYPTPKWIKESQKENFGVPSAFVGGVENIEACAIPNSAWRGRVSELLALHDHISGAWRDFKEP